MRTDTPVNRQSGRIPDQETSPDIVDKLKLQELTDDPESIAGFATDTYRGVLTLASPQRGDKREWRAIEDSFGTDGKIRVFESRSGAVEPETVAIELTRQLLSDYLNTQRNVREREVRDEAGIQRTIAMLRGIPRDTFRGGGEPDLPREKRLASAAQHPREATPDTPEYQAQTAPDPTDNLVFRVPPSEATIHADSSALPEPTSATPPTPDHHIFRPSPDLPTTSARDEGSNEPTPEEPNSAEVQQTIPEGLAEKNEQQTSIIAQNLENNRITMDPSHPNHEARMQSLRDRGLVDGPADLSVGIITPEGEFIPMSYGRRDSDGQLLPSSQDMHHEDVLAKLLEVPVRDVVDTGVGTMSLQHGYTTYNARTFADRPPIITAPSSIKDPAIISQMLEFAASASINATPVGETPQPVRLEVDSNDGAVINEIPVNEIIDQSVQVKELGLTVTPTPDHHVFRPSPDLPTNSARDEGSTEPIAEPSHENNLQTKAAQIKEVLAEFTNSNGQIKWFDTGNKVEEILGSDTTPEDLGEIFGTEAIIAMDQHIRLLKQTHTDRAAADLKSQYAQQLQTSANRALERAAQATGLANPVQASLLLSRLGTQSIISAANHIRETTSSQPGFQSRVTERTSEDATQDTPITNNPEEIPQVTHTILPDIIPPDIREQIAIQAALIANKPEEARTADDILILELQRANHTTITEGLSPEQLRDAIHSPEGTMLYNNAIRGATIATLAHGLALHNSEQTGALAELPPEIARQTEVFNTLSPAERAHLSLELQQLAVRELVESGRLQPSTQEATPIPTIPEINSALETSLEQHIFRPSTETPTSHARGIEEPAIASGEDQPLVDSAPQAEITNEGATQQESRKSSRQIKTETALTTFAAESEDPTDITVAEAALKAISENGVSLCFTNSSQIGKELQNKIDNGELNGSVRMWYGEPVQGMGVGHAIVLYQTEEGITYAIDSVGQRMMGLEPGITKLGSITDVQYLIT